MRTSRRLNGLVDGLLALKPGLGGGESSSDGGYWRLGSRLDHPGRSGGDGHPALGPHTYQKNVESHVFGNKFLRSWKKE